ncbi:uncharacterized protein LOC130054973 [Ostrea edulis]|uniref:uncharacterized protein LOC130054973 n=1 Tax=Ostrea edulis TaxID=37623 RepID=UPI0024AF7AC8|nr:uncharacterized protein LOC130054973 [Ostrea edulis]
MQTPRSTVTSQQRQSRRAITILKIGKTAGPDEIPAETIKADTETAVNILHNLFEKIWEEENIPEDWKEGILIKLPKKGNLRDCSDYRGIMLLSVSGKVLNRILLERMKEAVDPKLRDQQAGFRRNRSCADQIANLRIIIEQSLEWKYPSISTSSTTRKRSTAWTTTTSDRNNGIQWTLLTQLDDLDFADDLALLSHKQSNMQNKTTHLVTISAGTGLKINLKKTGLMKINTTVQLPVTIGGEPIREVESFIYLGSVMDRQGGTDRDIKSRIDKAGAAFTMLKNIWASKNIRITTKLRILNSGYDLARRSKNSPESCSLEDCRRWPMFLTEGTTGLSK